MKIQEFQLKHIGCFTELKIEPGKITRLQGGNGVGKSTVINALKNVLKGGYDAKLIQNGQDSGQVVIVFDDGVKLTKTITHNGGTIDARHPKTGKIANAASYIKGLTDIDSFNPAAFLDASPKERLEKLLKVLPVKIDSVTFDEIRPSGFKSSEDNGLVVLDLVRTLYFNQRTDANRSIKERQATIERLRSSLPPNHEQLESIDLSGLEQKVVTIEKEISTNKEEIINEGSQRCSERTALAESKSDEVRAEYQRKLHELQDWRDAELTAILTERTKDIDAIQERTLAAIHMMEQNLGPQLESAKEALTEARTRSGQLASVKNTLSFIDDERLALESLEAEQKELNTKLDRVAEIKLELLKNIPIEGLEIKDGEIYLNGLHWDQLNTAKQMYIAFQVGLLGAGDLPVMIVDHLEAFDSERLKQFEELAMTTDKAIIYCRTTEGSELQVEAA